MRRDPRSVYRNFLFFMFSIRFEVIKFHSFTNAIMSHIIELSHKVKTGIPIVPNVITGVSKQEIPGQAIRRNYFPEEQLFFNQR